MPQLFVLERASGTHNYTVNRQAAPAHLHVLCSVPESSSTVYHKPQKRARHDVFISILCLECNERNGHNYAMKKNKISVSTYSFSNALYTEKMPTLDDLFRVASELGMDGVEIVSFNIMDRDPNAPSMMGMGGDPDKAPDPLFPDGSRPGGQQPRAPMNIDPTRLKAMRERMSKAGRTRPSSIDKIKEYLKKYNLEVSNMPVDFGDIGNSDHHALRSDIEMLKMWIDIAAELGSPSVRFNSGTVRRDDDGNLDLSICINSYRELAEYGVIKGVMVTMENHGGATEYPEACVAIYNGVNHQNFQLTPDLGNFHLGEGMYNAIDMMFSCSKPVCTHVKTYAFGDEYGKGSDSHTDFRRMAEIVHKHKYDGWYSIKCNGACGKDYENIIKTKGLIDRYFKV